MARSRSKSVLGVGLADVRRFVFSGAGVAAGTTTVMLVKFGNQADFDEIVRSGLVIGVVAHAAGWAIVRGRSGIAEWLDKRGITWRIWEYFISEEEDEYLDWISQIEAQYVPGRRKYALPIGVDEERGKAHTVSMKNDQSHFVFSGASGTGKSVMVNQFLAAALRSNKYQVLVLTLSAKDYGVFEGVPNFHIRSFMDGTQTADRALTEYGAALPEFVESVNQEILRRQRLASQHQARDLHNVRADQRPPALLVVLEEASNAFLQVGHGMSGAEKRQAKDRFVNQLRTAFNFGRSSLVHMVLISQRPSGVIPVDIKQNAVCITTAVRGAKEAAFATGISQSGAEDLRRYDPDTDTPGQAMLVSNVSSIVEIPYSSDHQLRELVTSVEIKAFPVPDWAPGFHARPRQVTVDIPLSRQREDDYDKPSDVAYRSVPAAAAAARPVLVPTLFQKIWLSDGAKSFGPEIKADIWLSVSLMALSGMKRAEIQEALKRNNLESTAVDQAVVDCVRLLKSVVSKFDIKAFRTQLNTLTRLFKFVFESEQYETPGVASMSVEQWQLLGLLQMLSLSENRQMKVVFAGANGRYRARVKLAAEFKALHNKYMAARFGAAAR